VSKYQIETVQNLGPMNGTGKTTYVAVITDTTTGKTIAQSAPKATPDAAEADAAAKFTAKGL
jgi:ABC-type branched-subunit amino acid transport system ATPase component